jgi:nucleoside-triphosphatase THEP1
MQVSPILLLTGGTGSGKTIVLKRILQELGESSVISGGILAPGRYLETNEKEFDLELIPGEEKYFLSTRIQYSGWQAIGGFRFNPEAVEAGVNHLKSLPGKQYDLYVLDEIGPFELDGLLWAAAIPDLIRAGIPMIWTVRTSLLEKVCAKWDIKDPVIITKEKGKPEKAMDEIRKWLQENIQGLS